MFLNCDMVLQDISTLKHFHCYNPTITVFVSCLVVVLGCNVLIPTHNQPNTDNPPSYWYSPILYSLFIFFFCKKSLRIREKDFPFPLPPFWTNIQRNQSRKAPFSFFLSKHHSCWVTIVLSAPTGAECNRFTSIIQSFLKVIWGDAGNH